MNRGKIACAGTLEEALSFYHAESEERRDGPAMRAQARSGAPRNRRSKPPHHCFGI
jgi:hypothetical protein